MIRPEIREGAKSAEVMRVWPGAIEVAAAHLPAAMVWNRQLSRDLQADKDYTNG